MELKCETYENITERLYEFNTALTCIIVQHCIFQNTSANSNDNGGAISCNNEQKDLSILDCAFYQCSSSNQGGAIYCQINNAEFGRICTYGCQLTKDGNDNNGIFIHINNCKKYIASFVTMTNTNGTKNIWNCPTTMSNYIYGWLSNINGSYCNSAITGNFVFMEKCRYSSFNYNNNTDHSVFTQIAGAEFKFCSFSYNKNQYHALVIDTGDETTPVKITGCYFVGNSNNDFRLGSGYVIFEECYSDENLVIHSSFSGTISSIGCVTGVKSPYNPVLFASEPFCEAIPERTIPYDCIIADKDSLEQLEKKKRIRRVFSLASLTDVVL